MIGRSSNIYQFSYTYLLLLYIRNFNTSLLKHPLLLYGVEKHHRDANKCSRFILWEVVAQDGLQVRPAELQNLCSAFEGEAVFVGYRCQVPAL